MQRVDTFSRSVSRAGLRRAALSAALLFVFFGSGFAQLAFDNLPADANIACLTAPDATGITASGGCAPAVITVADGPAQPDACNGTVLRTFTATDGCETITGTQTLTVVDDVAPVITIVQPDLQSYADGDSVFVECNSGFAMSVSSATATDNCAASPTLEFVENFGQAFDCATTGQIATMTCGWRAEDACGNVSTLMLTIIIRDTEAPQLLGTPVSTTATCGNVPAPAPVAATDQCDQTVTVDFEEARTNLDCPGNYRLTRTWSATDACGNVSTHVQTIDVSDTTPPELEGVPANDTISCTTPPAPPAVTATDDCDPDVTVQYTEVINGTVCDGATITRTWTATDACNNTTSATQIITITDDVAPTITGVPADVTIGCGQLLPNLPQISIDDDCTALPQFDFNEAVSSNGCEQITLRTWTATDGCGNVTTASQRITRIDQIAPALTPVASALLGVADQSTLDYECGTDPSFGAADVSASDDCTSTLTPDLTVTVLSDAACDRNTRYVWTVTDDCGNATSYTVFVRVRDTQRPVLSGVPADATAACGNVPAPPAVTALDNCSLAPVSFSESTSGSTCAERRLTRTWTATDACGNTVSAQQIITLTDTEAPVLVGVPDDVDLGCGTVSNPPGVTATDNCDANVTVSFSETTNGSTCANREIVRTWTATDLCGNTTSASQTITMTDEEAPQFTQTPPTLSFSCNKVIPNPVAPTAVDNCDQQLDIVFSETTQPGDCPQNFSLLRTWTAMDDCGNSVAISQTIHIVDEEPPVFDALPADLTLACTTGLPDPAPVTATDGCDPDVTVTSTTEVVGGTDVCTGLQYRRVYVASDACGNTVSTEQLITLTDDVAPVLQFVHPDLVQYKNGDTVVFECQNFFDLEPTVIATDACDDDVDISFIDIPTPAPDCADAGYLAELYCEWTATDDCGNTATLYVIVRLRDTTAPVFDCPGPVTVAPGQPLPAATAPPVSDNCTDNLNPTLSEVQVDDPDGCGYTLERTWTVTDECGNTGSCTQVITVLENCGCPTIEVAAVMATPADCDLSNGTVTLELVDDPSGFAYAWSPDAGTSNGAGNVRTDLPAGNYLIVITDPNQPNGNCETKVNVTVAQNPCDPTGPCEWDYFGDEDSATVGMSDPVYCLPFNAANNFSELLLNNVDYIPPPNPCAIDSLVYYTYALVDKMGSASGGPYRVDSWTYPGGIWTGIVQDMDELAAKMLQLDPAGNWTNKPNSFIIDGAQTLQGYGQLIITRIASNITTTIQRNYTGAAFGTEHVFDAPGDYIWTVGNADGCVDSLFITVIDDIVPLQEDTIYVAVPYETTTQFCLDASFLAGTPVAVVVLEDVQSGFLDDGVPCPTYLPFNGFSGLDDALLMLCDDQGICDTTRAIFNVAPALTDPCGDPVFAQAFTSYTLEQCTDQVTVCADIPEGQAANYAIYQNGQPYGGPITGCAFDTTYSYSYFLLPGNGQNGPYQLQDWLVNGVPHSLAFDDYTELIAQMNVWDPTGHWTDQADGLSIEGGDAEKVYGPLRITHLPTGILSHLELNEGIDVIGMALRVGEGQHELVLLNTLSGCADTSYVQVHCTPVAAGIQAVDGHHLQPHTPNQDTIVKPGLTQPVPGVSVVDGFSPNNDGVNDVFRVGVADEPGGYELRVYNRYGNEVYQSAAYANDWDGTQYGQPLPEGIYFYLLRRTDGRTQRGFVALKR